MFTALKGNQLLFTTPLLALVWKHTYLFWTLHVDGIVHVWPMVTGFFLSIIQSHPLCSMVSAPFLLWLSNIPLLHGPWFVCPSPADGHVGCFHFLDIVTSIALNIREQVLPFYR